MPKHKRRNEPSITLDDLFTRLFQDLFPHMSVDVRDDIWLSHSVGGLTEVAQFLERKISGAESHREFLTYACLRQLDALFSKNASMPGTGPKQRREAAFAKFLLSEEKCAETNARLTNRRFLNHSSLIDRVVMEAQSFIHDALGPLPNASSFWRECKFGPGMTFGSDTMEHSNLYFKVAGPHTVTPECLPFIASPSFVSSWPLWTSTLASEGACYDLVKGNRVTTVPKTAVTDRTIAIEPSMNVFLQKGIETVLTRRLRRKGLDLSSQERNQCVAKDASCRRNTASTIDLSSASDTISVELVRLLLPLEWFLLLDETRSQYYTLDKGESWSRYEKFSSMGNAFTFPLETLIFYSVARACTIVTGGSLDVLRVYGDDIIIDDNASLLLLESLDFLGFTPNPDKSFIHGWFRETCGHDYLGGVDVRPVYVRKIPGSEAEVYNLYNRLLNNRIGFRFDRTLSYLLGSLRHPKFGPPFLPAGDDYWLWYSGKSVEFDSYFHAPSHIVERFKRFDPVTQCFTWSMRALRRKARGLDTSEFNRVYWYLAFLRGLTSERIDSSIHFRYVSVPVLYRHWGDREWWPSWFYC